MKILLTGATGYIGKRILPVLVDAGHEVICCVRDKSRFKPPEAVKQKIKIIQIDLLVKESLDAIPRDIDGAYYLVHSMSASSDYQKLEQESAINFRNALNETKVRHVVYLSGIVNESDLSDHLESRKTVEFMRLNQLPDNGDLASMGQPVWSETNYEGIGFGIGWAVVLDPAKANIIASVGEHHWGGAASTFFWLDPEEEMFVIFLTQLIPSSTYPIRRELRSRVYQALID